MALDEYTQHRIEQYMARARQAVETGRLAMDHEDYIAAVNRAYYAIFYAANALLATKGLERSKHSGVISAFRQHFVKTGVIEPEFSNFYGEAMDDRHTGDYELGVSGISRGECLFCATSGRLTEPIPRCRGVIDRNSWLPREILKSPNW